MQRNKTTNDDGKLCPSNILEYPKLCDLNYWISCFVVEARREHGDPYPATTLSNLLSRLHRHCREYDAACPNFMRAFLTCKSLSLRGGEENRNFKPSQSLRSSSPDWYTSKERVEEQVWRYYGAMATSRRKWATNWLTHGFLGSTGNTLGDQLVPPADLWPLEGTNWPLRVFAMLLRRPWVNLSESTVVLSM